MNNIYRVVWSEVSATWIAVSEITGGRAKSSRSANAASGDVQKQSDRGMNALRQLPSALLAMGLGFCLSVQAAPPIANQLPTGGQVSAGSAALSQAGAVLNVNQSSARAVIDWQTFNLGSQAQINFNQPSAASATLNRVQDVNPSQIFGRITAPGTVVLTNPNGVYFSPTASVDVGSFVATTHSIGNSDFMNGAMKFSRDGAEGAVVNDGHINSGLGGYVALLAPEVRNNGIVIARMGTAALAAGEDFELQFNNNNTLSNVRVTPATLRAWVENSHAVQAPGGLIILSAQAADALQSGVINNTGTLAANTLTQKDGVIRLSASHALIQTGTVQASTIQAETKNLIDAGIWDASATSNGAAQGGNINIAASAHIEQTAAGVLKADGDVLVSGGSIRVTSSGDAWLSGAATAIGRTGGDIAVTAPNLTVAGANLNASGVEAGGRIRLGGGWQGRDTDLGNASTTSVVTSQMDVSATTQGHGGTAVVWSNDLTQFSGQVHAKGGAQRGNGGQVEVSSHGQLNYAGNVDATAPNGTHGQLLLDPQNIEIVSSAQTVNALNLAVPSPTANSKWGTAVLELMNNGVATGNIAVSSQTDSTVAASSGAVRLYNGLTGALISTLTGSVSNDRVGMGGMTHLGNGHFVVSSYNWTNGVGTPTNNVGAATWVNGNTGLNGVVSSSNSLVGSATGDKVGFGVVALGNGNYIVKSPYWDGTSAGAYTYGAVTWGNGSSGVSGVLSSSNSLVGTATNDKVGQTDVKVLTNNNYVVVSHNWNSNRGAVTWGSGTSGVSGAVSSSNSLVGSAASDYVGDGGVTELSNGNYVVASALWDGSASTYRYGAATWGSGTAGVSGVVSSANSLVGNVAQSYVSSEGIKALTNGNYLVISKFWNDSSGAVTWGNGATGTSGTVSASNSLVGSTTQTASGGWGDQVGSGGVIEIPGNRYVVFSPSWINGASQGAGAITQLSATGSTGVAVSASNSLVGTNTNDNVGTSDLNTFKGAITMLTDGKYVIASPYWNNLMGAVTRIDPSVGTSGVVSGSNSWVGSTPGGQNMGDTVGIGGIKALANGALLIISPNWWNGSAQAAGAVTFVSSTTPTGTVSSVNSLVGDKPNDGVGNYGVTALPSGNYVVRSPTWGSDSITTNVGAVTWGSGTTGVAGVVSGANSLIGSNTGDTVGLVDITVLPVNGNYVVNSPSWKANGSFSGSSGAVTWGSGNTGVRGTISSANSLVGSEDGDSVGSSGITAMPSGNYVFRSPNWGPDSTTRNLGAITWSDGSAGATGTISSTNSMTGSQAGDFLGSGAITTLTNGNYAVISPNWRNGAVSAAGAITWGSGATPLTGIASASNSLVGNSASDFSGATVLAMPNGGYLVATPNWNNGTITDAGAVTINSSANALTGIISSSNSFMGASASDKVGNVAPIVLSDGRVLVTSTLAKVNSLASAGRVDILSLSSAPTPNATEGFSTNASSNSVFAAADVTNLLNAGTAVTLQANTDITVSAPLLANNPGGNGGALTLQAGRSILINANITTDNGALTLVGNETVVNGVVNANRSAGAAQITMANGTAIDAGSGAVNITMGTGANGSGNNASGSINLRDITAGVLNVTNSGTAANSSVNILGTINASSTIAIAAANGDVAVSGDVLTTDASSTALTINAGLTASAGTSTGGDIILTGSPNVSVGVGGTGTFYTGSLAGSTGLATLVGVGNSRYSSDETDTHFSTALAVGLNAVYRESPSVTLQANAYSSMYGGAVTPTAHSSSGNLQNSDTNSGSISGITISSTGTPTSNAGAYDLSIQGSAYTSLGYAVTPVVNTGGHTITQRPITITADAKTRVYGDANPALTYTVAADGVGTSRGLVNSDTLTGSPSTTATATSNVGSFTIDASGLANGNYLITANNGTLTVTQRPITVTADSASKNSGEIDPTLTYAISSGSLQGNDALVGSLTRAQGEAAGTYVISPAGLANGNYVITYIDGVMTIVAAPSTSTFPTPPPLVLPTPLFSAAPIALQAAVISEAVSVAATGNSAVDSANTTTSASSQEESGSSANASASGNGPASTNNTNRNRNAPTTTTVSNSGTPQGVTTFAKSGLTVTLVNATSAQTGGVVNVALPKEMARPGSAFAFPLPSKAVSTTDANANQVRVSLPNGNPLPAWLSYNAQTRVVTASAVPEGALPMQVMVNAAGNSTAVVIAQKP